MENKMKLEYVKGNKESIWVCYFCNNKSSKLSLDYIYQWQLYTSSYYERMIILYKNI